MIRSEKMILRKTDEMANWLFEATAIYNQGLYFLRQEYFAAQKENRQPKYSNIKLYDLDGNFIREWSSATDVGEKVNDGICKCLKGKNKTAYGFIWKYKDDINYLG